MILCKYGCGREAKYQLKNGKWCCSKSQNSCPEIKKKTKGMEGKGHSKETKKKISESHKGKHHSKETKEKMRKNHKGKHHSEESKQKIKENHTDNSGKNHYMYGKHFSKEIREKFSESLRKRWADPNSVFRKKSYKDKQIKSRKGYKHSERTKRNMRLAAIKRIENNIGQISPNYNPAACKIIDKYGKQHGYNFQHAENGGEFYIKELGYWVDGYDKEKNVVMEIDESFHYDGNDNLKERDKQRQEEITNFLKCKFIRIKI